MAACMFLLAYMSTYIYQTQYFSIFRSFNLEFLWTYYQIRIIFKWKNRQNYKETIVSIG